MIRASCSSVSACVSVSARERVWYQACAVWQALSQPEDDYARVFVDCLLVYATMCSCV